MMVNTKKVAEREKYIFGTQVLSFLVLAILILRVITPENLTFQFSNVKHTASILVILLPLISIIRFKYVDSFIPDLFINGLYILITTFFLFFESDNLFKILLLMPAVTIALKYGFKPAIYTSICSIIALISTGFKNNFISIDADIMLSGVIFLSAWLLGNMTETENHIRKELERLANFDGLTDIYNHRSFQNLLDEELSKGKEENTSVSLILLDIDYFKVYNDSFGHQKGDQVLKEVARILKQVSSDLGYCARYGGEEFAVILPQMGIKAAKLVGEEIRERIEETKFTGIEVLPKGKLTASIGIAEFPLMADSKEKLIQKADEALYKAKFVSKNKVETYYSVFDELGGSLKGHERELFNSIRTLTMVINAKDKYTFGHSERTMELSKKLAERIGLKKEVVNDITYGALLHDIGKIEISREVLNKPARLNAEEWEIFKQHPQWGADIIRPLNSFAGALDIILGHHENFDGSGYPHGLKGEEIAIGARLLRIIDSYDAMITNRPYKEAMSKEQAMEELQKYDGIHYDPWLLKEFITMLSEQKEDETNED